MLTTSFEPHIYTLKLMKCRFKPPKHALVEIQTQMPHVCKCVHPVNAMHGQ